MEEVFDRLRTSITTVSTDRDRIRIALLSAARESDFLLEATFIGPWPWKSRLKLVPILVAPFRSRLIGSLH